MKKFLIFIGGVALGAGASWVYHKNKYEQIIQEEVESLREHMKEKETKDKKQVTPNPSGVYRPYNKEQNISEREEPTESDEYVEKYTNIVNHCHYANNDDDSDDEIEVDNRAKPFVVTPEEFGNVSGFDVDTFYYHHDDIISNDDQEIVEDIEEILGHTIEEIKGQFGVYEDDAVYVRNIQLKCDYEILREDDDYKRRNGD